ncbi:MAG TPA: oligoendopeptidase F, partial [Albitalea sp.]
MRSGIIAFVLACLGAANAHAESTADRWNLADLYATPAAWDADAARLEAQLAELARCKGHLGDSAARLRQCLDLRADMTRRLYRLGVFSGEQLAADTGLATSLALDQRADVLGNRLEEAGAFFEPEILRLGAAKVAQFLGQDAGLRIHRFPLERIVHAAPHTLDDAGETLVAKFGLMGGAGGAAYSILSNADMPWPKVKLSTGEDITLDQSAYTKYREAPERADRKRVMDAFFATWKTYERTMGVMLHAQLKQEAVYSSVRKYPDSISRALDRNRIPPAVVDTLIA